jgi:hypothetical protein
LGVSHAVSGFLLIFLTVLLEVLNVKIIDKNDIKRILKIETENDFVGRFADTNVLIRIKYPNNRIKEFYPYLIGITGVKYA